MNPNVTSFISSSEVWQTELEQLRVLLLDCGLEEEFKWKQPCYTFKGKNILILTHFKDFCTLSFFKGVFLKDEDGLLEAPGENSRTVRMMKFKKDSETDIDEALVKSYVFEAIEVEKAGLKVDTADPNELDFPEELQNKMDQDEKFKTAFEGLTPGRQRAYLIFFNQGKQAKTRENRIKKYEGRILMGKGMNDCVCGLSKRMPNCDGSHKELNQ